jgi:hypothetical protein
MTIHYLFADEAGDFTFSNKGRASRYFVLCSITMRDTSIGQSLLELRRKLLMEGHGEGGMLHASKDPRPRRDRVFDVLESAELRADATIFEKAKAQPHVRTDNPTFYKYVWHLHLKGVLPRILRSDDRILITAASVNTNDSKAAFKSAINDVMQQFVPRDRWRVAFLAASEDPCLWAADYVAWAIARKWERGDVGPYERIAHLVRTEFDVWQRGKQCYY